MLCIHRYSSIFIITLSYVVFLNSGINGVPHSVPLEHNNILDQREVNANPIDIRSVTTNNASANSAETITTTTATQATTTKNDTNSNNNQGKSCSFKDNEFPFFSQTNCISRSSYTGIVLTSIILAGISFLLILAIAGFLIYQKLSSRDSYSSDGDTESDTSSKTDATSRHSTISKASKSTRHSRAKPRQVDSESSEEDGDEVSGF